MSNAIVVPASFQQGQVAPAFQGQAADDDLSGGITGGYGLIKYRGKVWSIQHNGTTQTLMREDGDGPRGSVDVIILKANAQLSKTFYVNGWDENSNNPPDCASENGIVPDQGVPHPQHNICATCPKNAWSSAPNGGKGKACGDHRRLAVVPLADPRNEALGGPLLLRCPAASLQELAAFDSRYKGMGYPYFTMGIKIGFDPAESYPKFTFQAIRPLTDDEAKIVLELRNSADVSRVIGERSSPAPAAQVAAAPQGAFLEPPPAGHTPPAATQQVSSQPVTQPTQAAQPARSAGPVVGSHAGQPTAQQPASTAGGFGAAAPATGDAAAPAATPAQQPTQQTAPQRAMTGFGATQPEVTQQVTQQAPQQNTQAAQPEAPPAAATAQTAPGVVTAFEGSIDDRLSALLGDS